MKKIFGLLALAAGAAAGFLAGKLYYEEKYRQYAQEEVTAVRAFYKKKREGEKPTPAVETKTTEKKAASVNPAVPVTYTNYYRGSPETEKPKKAPYIIKPDEFSSKPGFDTVTLTYYRDGVVADESDIAMSRGELARTLGPDALNHFGEYEKDSVFVRNPDQELDYEIQLDNRTYAEVVGEKPYLLEK